MWHLDDEDDDERGNNDEKGPDGRLEVRLLKTRTLVVAGTVSDTMYRKVATALMLLEQASDTEKVTLLVNSPGGSADSGFAIYDLLRFSSCPVTTIANGMVASSAVLIYCAADEGMRLSLPHSRFLLHQPSTFTRGQASDIDITAREIVKLRTRYNKVMERHTGREMATLEKDASRDFWLSAPEAKEYGLVERIVESRSEV